MAVSDMLRWPTLPSLPRIHWRSTGYALSIVIGCYLLVTVALAWWWDTEPDMFDVVAKAETHATANGNRVVNGYTTTATVAALTEILLRKRGGYLSNDIFPPGVWMDNIPNWEFGVLTQVRDMGRSLRIEFSRSQSQSNEDPDLAEAEGKFFYDNSSWIFPESENEYEDGLNLLDDYLKRLSSSAETDAQFYARADNLRSWLIGVSTRLGGLSQRLSESVGKQQLNLAIAGDPNAVTATDAPTDREVKTSWFEIDDVFYEARGQAWALVHLLKAVEHDFAPILEDKNAVISLRQVIRDLEATQETVWSPFILNGGGFGMLANHSLVMASYISRVNAAIIDLTQLLAQG